MDYNYVKDAVLELVGEPVGSGVIGSGRWGVLEVERAINGSVAYVYDVLNEQSIVDDISVVPGTASYPLSKSVRTSSVAYVDGKKLSKVECRSFPRDLAVGRPTQFMVVCTDESNASGTTIVFYPEPDTAFSVKVYSSGFSPVSDGGIINLPDQFLDIVVYGAASILASKITVNGGGEDSDRFLLWRNNLVNQIMANNKNINLTQLWSHSEVVNGNNNGGDQGQGQGYRRY